MDLLAHLFAVEGNETSGPTADFWYTNAPGEMTLAGQRVDAEGAQKISAWYRGRDILATVLAMLPLKVYERLPNDGGSEPAVDQPLYDVLHDTPNSWQDSFQWRRQKMYDVIDHGWTYDDMVAGPRGFAHELQPIAPTLVTPDQIKSGPNRGRYLFRVRDEHTGQTTVRTQDELFYLRGAGGKGVLHYARTSLGTALATESYAANIFSRGTLNGGTIAVPGPMEEPAMRAMARQFVTRANEHHMPKVITHSATFTPNGMTPEDAQMLLSRKHSIDDMARWLGIPRQMLENSDPSFGNAEQFDDNFITYTMGPWLSMFEFGINSQLILNPKKYYAEFSRDAVVRGKFLERAQGNVALVNAGIVTVDEVRGTEGYNKKGGKADELRDPQNITGKPAAAGPDDPTADPAPKPAIKLKPKPADGKARAIVTESAARLLRKEITAVQKAAVKFAADADAFTAWVTDFYIGHAALVGQTLQMDEGDAEMYCMGQAQQIVNGDGWVASVDLWGTDQYAAGLAALALDEDAA